jgi:4-hydroxy-3-methylbut-2-enyl diphosphate reductase
VSAEGFAVRAKPGQLQRAGIGLSVDLQQVWLDVAITITSPIAASRGKLFLWLPNLCPSSVARSTRLSAHWLPEFPACESPMGTRLTNWYTCRVTLLASETASNLGRVDHLTGQKRVMLLKPRGFCAGVVRAIDIVKIALDTFGAPIYVRREIVHNRFVVNELAEKGAIFVNEIEEVPAGQRVIYSAHGVSPAVREASKARGLKVIDATCPLVTKVHVEAVKFAKQGYSLVLVGHRDHDEIEGTLGEAPEATQVVSNVAEVEALVVPDPNRVAYLTQTTLSLDEARDIIHALKVKFPNIAGPHTQDICYATENRQVAVRNVAPGADLVLVVGSTNSSNSNRLVEVSNNLGTKAYLIDNSAAIDPKWLEGVDSVAVTAGASAPEVLVEDVINYLQQNGYSGVEEVEVMPENVRFGLPPEIIQAIGGAGGAQPIPVR